MSRKKNLLEAFKRSDAPSAGPGLPPSSPAAPVARGLFEDSGQGPGRGRRPSPVWALLAAGVVLAFVLGYALGRGANPEARAGEAESPAALRTPHTPPASQARSFQERPSETTPAARTGAADPAEPGRLEDSPLFAPENLHTVVVAAYSNANQDLAWATYEHLREEGLTVFPPVASRNLVLVLAGAAPSTAELAKTLTSVRAALRNGKAEYDDAYLARIDTLIPRPKTKGTEKP